MMDTVSKVILVAAVAISGVALCNGTYGAFLFVMSDSMWVSTLCIALCLAIISGFYLACGEHVKRKTLLPSAMT